MKRAALLLLPAAASLLAASVQPAAAGPYVTTRWSRYSGPPEGCMHAARRTLEARRLPIEKMSPVSVAGGEFGYTISIRCDAPGYAFIVLAFSDNAPPPARERFADDVRHELERHFGGGGGRY
ncbi:hypothetical protein [Roseiterribacter gracilis]|uniref:Uncharacterized protein n=1 Tax=Roseiterribacter gracilis TaxID=2812848 RepID=A0A8S8X8U0_9PROT|nr:hypothetical protein TMPK1_05180 [Rhodospirillales bacterium TMPK1]